MANFFDTERGPVGRMHVWVLVSLLIIVIAAALMIPHLRGELFGAAVALYDSVVN